MVQKLALAVCRLFAFVMLALALSLSHTTHAQAQTHTCEGEASVSGKTLIQAREEALNKALQSCIEQAIGVYIQSEFKATQSERSGPQGSELRTVVEDNLRKDAKGFVRGHRIVRRDENNERVRVIVEAEVYADKVKAEVARVQQLLQAAGRPQVAVLMHEFRVDIKGSAKPLAKPRLGDLLTKHLRERGYPVVEANALQVKGATHATQLDTWLAAQQGLAAQARAAGVEFLIIARAEWIDRGVFTEEEASPFTKGYVGWERLELSGVFRGLNTRTGELIQVTPIRITEFGATRAAAENRIIRGGRNVKPLLDAMDSLTEQLNRQIEQIAQQGRDVTVELRGVKSFRQQAQPFLSALGKLPGVTRVEQKAFEKGVLVALVTFRGAVADLQGVILGHTASDEALRGIDLESASAEQLFFSVLP